MIFFILTILIRVLFNDISLLSYCAIILSLYQFTLLFAGIGNIIPIRYLFGAFMCLQFCIGPVLVYNGLDQYQPIAYRMRISETDYFSYTLPAVILFILGLHITAGNFKGEILDEKGIKVFVNRNPRLPYIFIGIGFLASIASEFVASELAFVFYLLGSFKFVGLFLLVIGEGKEAKLLPLKDLKIVPLTLIFSSIIVSSLGSGMFHDLLTWIIFVGAVYAIQYRIGFNAKLIGCIIFILLAIIIQQLKGDYRESTQKKGEDTGIETLAETYEIKNEGDKSIFSFSSLAPSVTRINQGFIITNIIRTVPDREPFSNGEEMMQVLEAAILPRILAPNKLNAGDREVFMKYSGMHLREGTSMALSSIGDAYVNYGYEGGCIFMFFLGLTYSLVLNSFEKRSVKYPAILLFLPLIFYYPIRPDCELQTILGHLVKAVFLVLVMVYSWKSVFVDQSDQRIEPSLVG
jgi:hypothetical protein